MESEELSIIYKIKLSELQKNFLKNLENSAKKLCELCVKNYALPEKTFTIKKLHTLL
jgi:hypothetical protein